MGARQGIAKVEVACNNCGGTTAELVASGRDHEYPNTTSDEFQFVRCGCGLLYLNPRPAPSELGTIYPDDYYAYQLVERRASRPRGGDSMLARYMGWQLVRRLRPYAELVRKGGGGAGPHRILDIGCGDGAMLDAWQRAFGGEAETHGVELNARAAAIARSRGHAVVDRRIEEAELPRAHFDLIYSFHVIEHVEDPTAFLEQSHAALRPGGYLLIDTPNVDTFDFRLFRRRHWGAYHFPRHFNLYSARSFAELARKTGFEVVAFKYSPSAIFWVWTLHSIFYKRAPRLADRLFPPVDIFLRGSLWNVALLSLFTLVDYAAIALSGRCSQMRILLRPARSRAG